MLDADKVEQVVEINNNCKASILLHLLVGMHAVIGQFSGLYSPVPPTKINSLTKFCCKTVL